MEDFMMEYTDDSAWPELYPRASTALTNKQVEELGQLRNFSGRPYDKLIFSLNPRKTGCYQRGALPVPLARNNTCYPGWYCECHRIKIMENDQH